MVGVAKSFWVADPFGNPVFQFEDTPGKGLDKLTALCWFADPRSPTGFLAAEILFSGRVRN